MTKPPHVTLEVVAIVVTALVAIGCSTSNTYRPRSILILRAGLDEAGSTQYFLAANSAGMDFTKEQMWRYSSLERVAADLRRYSPATVYLDTARSAQKTTRRLDENELDALRNLTKGFNITFAATNG
jgi:hypothetical protein